jgi:N-methylhydantoinase A
VQAVIVPPLAGTLSAYGLSISALRLDLSDPLVCGLREVSPAQLTQVYESLETRAGAAMSGKPVRFARWLDGRYRGQTWETPSVPVPAGALDGPALDEIHENFHATHERLWGYALPDFEVTAMMARITAFADGDEPAESARATTPANGRGALGTTDAFLGSEWREVELRWRETLAVGEELRGPAILLEETSTIVVMPGDTARADELGHLWITWDDGDA